MSIDASAPAIVSQMSTQLDACAAWTGTNYYPKVDLESATLPVSVITELSASSPRIADVAYGWSGEIEVVIYSTDDIATLEALGRTIKNQLLAQSPGIPFSEITTGVVAELTPEAQAESESYNAIQITAAYSMGL